MNISKIQLMNYAKMISGIVMILLSVFGVVVEEEKVTFIIFAVLVLGFSAYSFFNRYKKGDLSLGGIRKQEVSNAFQR